MKIQYTHRYNVYSTFYLFVFYMLPTCVITNNLVLFSCISGMMTIGYFFTAREFVTLPRRDPVLERQQVGKRNLSVNELDFYGLLATSLARLTLQEGLLSPDYFKYIMYIYLPYFRVMIEFEASTYRDE